MYITFLFNSIKLNQRGNYYHVTTHVFSVLHLFMFISYFRKLSKAFVQYEYTIKELKHILWSTHDKEKLVQAYYTLCEKGDCAATRIYPNLDNYSAADIFLSVIMNNPQLIVAKLKQFEPSIQQNCLDVSLFETAQTCTVQTDAQLVIQRVSALLQAGAKPKKSLELVQNYLKMLEELHINYYSSTLNNTEYLIAMEKQIGLINCLKNILSRNTGEIKPLNY